MISHGKDIKVFCGNSNPKLANQICNQLFKNLGDCTCAHFAEGECPFAAPMFSSFSLPASPLTITSWRCSS